MPELSYLNLYTTDPDFNLAAEQYVFDSLPRDRSWLMLWQNDRAIIIGKYQNALAEINKPYVDENGIRVVRRLSGGGAVYHDMGNLNFTIITDAGDTDQLDLRLFCQPVARALGALGVNVEVNGRNDMTIDGKKFSGNAQYLRGGRVMHHGTLMFDSDLSVVAKALQVDQAKIQSKGVKSVRSRVTCVRPYLPEAHTLEEFRALLLEQLLKETPGEEYHLTEEDLAAINRIREERYATWEWNYGKSPEGSIRKRQRIEGCGLVELRMDTEHGRIRAASFNGDFFSREEPSVLASRMIGLRPEREDYEKLLQETDISRFFTGMTKEAFLELVLQE